MGKFCDRNLSHMNKRILVVLWSPFQTRKSLLSCVLKVNNGWVQKNTSLLVPAMGFPDGWVVKNPRAMQETQEMQVGSLGWEDPLEEDMATHSSILAWRIPMDRGAWWATVHWVTNSRTWLKWLSTHAVPAIDTQFKILKEGFACRVF